MKNKKLTIWQLIKLVVIISGILWIWLCPLFVSILVVKYLELSKIFIVFGFLSLPAVVLYLEEMWKRT